jgi:hypothetical protein
MNKNLSIMTINLEYGGQLTINGKKCKNNNSDCASFILEYIYYIKYSNPDIIAFQEISFVYKDDYLKNNKTTTSYKIAKILNYYYYESTSTNQLAIASKYPIKNLIDSDFFCGT